MRIGVLASGGGTNLQALIDGIHRQHGVEIAVVGSDKPQAHALARAEQAGILGASFPLEMFEDRKTRDLAVAGWLGKHDVELVVLAGYMALVTPPFLQRFPDAVINVHPSLLPSFPGLHAVEQAVAYGAKVVGVTVHFVDEGVDTGSIILQRAIELEQPAQDAAALLEKLRPLEHDLLPRAVKLIAAGQVRFDNHDKRKVFIG